MKFWPSHNNRGYIKPQKSIHLELSRRCILECPKCARTRNKGNYLIGDLDYDIFVNIVKTLDVMYINMCGNMGDPIYHHRFIDIVKFLNKEKIFWTCRTNGSGKKMEWWNKVYNAYDDIGMKYPSSWIFGVDGLENTSNLYRVNQKWQESFDAMKLGVKLGKKIVWQWIPFSFNEHQIEEAKQMAKDNGIIFLIVLSSRFGKNDPLKPSERWRPKKKEATYDMEKHIGHKVFGK